MKKNQHIVWLLMASIAMTSCNEFLNEKSDRRLAIPNTVQSYKALLNDAAYLSFSHASSGESSTNDYYLRDSDFNSLTYESDKRLYTWQPDYVSRTVSSAGDEWYNCYRAIYVCNSVLHGLEENDLRGIEADNLRGQALVFRASRYLNGLQIWAPAYDKNTSGSDLGMVLREDPDMNLPSIRASVQQTYDQIIDDLNQALPLLPERDIVPTLPTKAAAYGILARAYLLMGDYSKALDNATVALSYNFTLIDFNKLNSAENYPIPSQRQVSTETIFWNAMLLANPLNPSRARITMELYDLYSTDDLRKKVYFRKNNDDTFSFKGTHTGGPNLICGITTSELYLIIAECYVREGNLSDAAQALNKLLINRLESRSFQPVRFTDKTEALRIVLEERRKELVMRGLRWSDLKRLNKEGANLTISRKVNGETYILRPNDLRYAIAIPEEVVEIGGIRQNPR